MTDRDEEQIGFDLGDSPRPCAYQPNLTEIREDLEAILQSARNVTVLTPWDQRTYRYNKVVFPQLTRWLPGDEAAQLCFEFRRELERIELLMAA